MKRPYLFIQVLIMILAVVGLTTIYQGDNFSSQQKDFWDSHGLILLFFLATFPRVTLVLSSLSTGGILWWLGWLFAPRYLVAILATQYYWKENPILVMISWLIALGGEASEKTIIFSPQRRTHFSARFKSSQKNQSNDGTIEADYRIID